MVRGAAFAIAGSSLPVFLTGKCSAIADEMGRKTCEHRGSARSVGSGLHLKMRGEQVMRNLCVRGGLLCVMLAMAINGAAGQTAGKHVIAFEDLIKMQRVTE